MVMLKQSFRCESPIFPDILNSFLNGVLAGLSLGVGIYTLGSTAGFFSFCTSFTTPLSSSVFATTGFFSPFSLIAALRHFNASIPISSASNYSVRSCIKVKHPLSVSFTSTCSPAHNSWRFALPSRQIAVLTSICNSSMSFDILTAFSVTLGSPNIACYFNHVKTTY